jgi:hypothetical protein
LDRTLDNLSNLIKSIRTLQQQQPTDELDQFILQCQVSETLTRGGKKERMNHFLYRTKIVNLLNIDMNYNVYDKQ